MTFITVPSEMNTRRNRNGFTLAELLIVVSLSSILTESHRVICLSSGALWASQTTQK